MIKTVARQLQEIYNPNQVGWTLGDILQRLEQYSEGLKEIQQGTFVYDNSLPKSCTIALYRHKVNKYIEVIQYLKTLDMNMIWCSDVGYNEEYDTYLKLVNR